MKHAMVQPKWNYYLFSSRLKDLLVQETPFGEDTAIDGDDPSHITWIYEKSMERAAHYGIQGVTYRLTQVELQLCK